MKAQKFLRATLIVVALCLPALVWAQETDTTRGQRTVIIVEEDGSVMVNGREVARVEPSGREVVVRRYESAFPRIPDVEFNLDGLPFIGLRDLEDRIHIQVGNREDMQEINRLERESQELARQLRRADENDRERLEGELQEKLEQLFDRRMELREKRVRALEDELKKQQEQLLERRRTRDELIERRMRELSGDRDELDW